MAELLVANEQSNNPPEEREYQLERWCRCPGQFSTIMMKMKKGLNALGAEFQVTRHGAVRYMKRWKENILYWKIRQSGLTLGPVAEGVDGRLCNIITIYTILIP
jgi:hypothetical protein